MSEFYLPTGLPIPVPEPSGLSKPFWDGLRKETIMVQRNARTGVYQFPPQWICHDTQTFDVEWVATEPRGVIYSWTRVWHPVHPAHEDSLPLYRRRGRAAAGRKRAHARQPAGRSAPDRRRSARRSRRCSNITKKRTRPTRSCIGALPFQRGDRCQ